MSSPTQYIVLHQSCRNHPGVTAVQAAHAAGESLCCGPARADTFVVVLIAETAAQLEALAGRLHGAGIHYALIREPDPPYNGSAVALGVEPGDRDRLRNFFVDFKVFR